MCAVRTLGEDAPHLVLTSEPVTFESLEDEEDSVPRGTEAAPVPGSS